MLMVFVPLESTKVCAWIPTSVPVSPWTQRSSLLTSKISKKIAFSKSVKKLFVVLEEVSLKSILIPHNPTPLPVEMLGYFRGVASCFEIGTKVLVFET